MRRTECVPTPLRNEGRAAPATEPEDDALPTALAERVDEERFDDEDLFLLEPGDQLGHRSPTFGSVIKPCGAKPLSREVSWRRVRERERGDPRVGRRVQPHGGGVRQERGAALRTDWPGGRPPLGP